MSVSFEKFNQNDIICECCQKLFNKNDNMYKIITYSTVPSYSPKIFCEKCTEHPGYDKCPFSK